MGSLEDTNNDGTYFSPFGNIVKALSYANEFAADKGITTINIYLLSGDDHYMTRKVEAYYYPQLKNSILSLDQKINIQPAFCGHNYGGHYFDISDNDCYTDGSKATVYYKMGNGYRFFIPELLSITSIRFDALDSSIDPTDECLRENSACCHISGTTLSEVTANS